MSHSTKINGTLFIHDGDYGEDIEICTSSAPVLVPFEDLKGFVANYVRDRKIRALEQMSDDELLGA